jgi:hypothetical protein
LDLMAITEMAHTAGRRNLVHDSAFLLPLGERLG